RGPALVRFRAHSRLRGHAPGWHRDQPVHLGLALARHVLAAGRPQKARAGAIDLGGAMNERQKFVEFIRPGTKIEFIGHMWFWIGSPILFLIITFAMLPINRYLIKSRGAILNWGVDFRGGTEMTVDFNREVDPGQLRSALDKAGFANSDVVKINEAGKVEYL